MTEILMPKATAVWLVDNTSLTFEQIADFCGLHPLEVPAVLATCGALATPKAASPAPTGFGGFCSDTFTFLRELEGNNSRDWMTGQRDRYRFAGMSSLFIRGGRAPAEWHGIRADPSAYGFTDTTTGALNDGVSSGDGYLFWDEEHPTTAGHKFIGDLAFASIVPEPSSITLLATGAVVLLAARYRHRVRLALARPVGLK